MHDALRVRRLERIRDLHGRVEQRNDVEALLDQAHRQRLPFQQFHDDEMLALVLLDGVDRADVRVIERRRRAGLALKPLERLRVAPEFRRQELQRHAAAQTRVFRFVDHAHTAAAERPDDIIVRHALANHRVGRHGPYLFMSGPRNIASGRERHRRIVSVQTMPDFQPSPADRFTFGLWTVGNRGRDPFGDPVRPIMNPGEAVRRLGETGAYGVNLHDNDLVPIDASRADRDRLVRDFSHAVAEAGLTVPMATTNLFTDPVFRDGAFTAHDPAVRAYARQKTMAAMDLAVELGARTFVFWGGREGAEVDAAKDPVEAIKRVRDAVNFLSAYARDQRYTLRFALEAKPNEPRGDLYFPTTSSYLAFIASLDHPDMVGVNPEVAHEQMAGLNFYHVVAQAIEAGKLFHIDLNDQKFGRFDQDLRFGSESIKTLFFVVKLLEESGYDGPRHFDAHPYRSESSEGVWDFARGCMRTYLILKEKARRFREDPEIQSILAELGTGEPAEAALLAPYSRDAATRLRTHHFDRARLSARALPYERLDQLVVDLLLGVR